MIFKAVQVDSFIKKPDAKVRVILVYGTNDGLQLDTIKKLARSICPNLQDAFQVAELKGDAVSADIGTLYGEFNAQSFMGGRRVVILQDAGDFLTKHLRKMLDETASENLLLLSGASLSKRSSLVKLVEESADMASVACYDDKNEDIQGMLKGLGLSFEPKAVELLYSKLSEDRMVNIMELEKLVTYMGTAKNVTPQIVEQVISDVKGADMEDIIYATLAGDRLKMLKLYNRYVNEGNDPVSVVRSLFYHFLKLLNAQAKVENGEGLERAVQSVQPKLMFFRVDAFRSQLRLWSKDKILKAMSYIFEAERDCKTTNMPSFELTSMALIRLAGAAKR